MIEVSVREKATQAHWERSQFAEEQTVAQIFEQTVSRELWVLTDLGKSSMEIPDYSLQSIPQELQSAIERASIEAEQTRKKLNGVSLFEVRVNDVEVPVSEWETSLCEHGDRVSIYAIPGGFGDFFKSAIIVFAVVFAITYIAIAVGAVTAIGTYSALQTALIYAGLAALSVILMGFLAPTLGGFGTSEPTYHIEGIGNDARQWQKVPKVFGDFRVYPPQAAHMYHEIVGKESYIRFLLTFGQGDISMGQLLLGNTPISFFKGVEFMTHRNTDTQDLRYYSGRRREDQYSLVIPEVLQSGQDPVKVRTRANSSEALLMFVFPQGLVYYSSKGGYRHYEITLRWSYERVGGSDARTTIIAGLLYTAHGSSERYYYILPPPNVSPSRPMSPLASWAISHLGPPDAQDFSDQEYFISFSEKEFYFVSGDVLEDETSDLGTEMRWLVWDGDTLAVRFEDVPTATLTGKSLFLLWGETGLGMLELAVADATSHDEGASLVWSLGDDQFVPVDFQGDISLYMAIADGSTSTNTVELEDIFEVDDATIAFLGSQSSGSGVGGSVSGAKGRTPTQDILGNKGGGKICYQGKGMVVPCQPSTPATPTPRDRCWDDTRVERRNSRTVRANSITPYRVAVRICFPEPGEYDISISKSGDYQRYERGSAGYLKRRHETRLETLQSVVAENPTNVAGLTWAEGRIQSSDQLSGRLDAVNAEVSARIPVWDGTDWTDDFTANPAWVCTYILKDGPFGVEDEDLDLDAWLAFAGFCEMRGYEYNGVMEATQTKEDALARVLEVAHAEMSRADAKYSVIWNNPDEPVCQVFSPRNCSLIRQSIEYVDELHGLRVSYVDPNLNWDIQEVIVYEEGYTEANATRFETLESLGITSRMQAVRFGRFHLAERRLRAVMYMIGTSYDHIACTRGSRVLLQGLDIGRRYCSARITAQMDTGGNFVRGFYVDVPPKSDIPRGLVPVEPEPTPPSLVAMQGVSIQENAPIGTQVGMLATPANFPDGVGAWSFADGTLSSPPFAIDGTTGTVSTTAELDFETQASYTLAIRYSQGGMTLQVDVVVSVGDVVETPPPSLLATSGLQVMENQPANTVIGQAATPANFPAGNPAWSFANGTTTLAPFSINASTGVLSTTTELDFETQDSYSFTVRLSQGGTTLQVLVRVSVVDVDETPAPSPSLMAASGLMVSENAPVGTDVGIAGTHANFPEGTGEWSLFATGEVPFVIHSQTGLIRTSGLLDFETQSSYTLTVEYEQGGTSLEVDLTITITDVVPSLTPNASLSVAEDADIGTEVGMAAVPNNFPAGTSVWSIQTASVPFTINSSTGVISTSAVLDYEILNSYTLTVRLTRGGETASASIQISVTDVDETPVIPPSLVATQGLSVAEDAPPGTEIGMAATPMNFPDGSHEWRLTSLNVPFAISQTGILRTTGALDFDTRESYNLAIGYTQGGTSLGVLVTVQVTEVLEPALVATQGLSVAEDVGIGTTIGVAAVASNFPAGTGAWSFANGTTTSNPFVIHPTTGVLSTNQLLDYETTTSYSLSVRFSQGGTSIEVDVSVSVTDVVETPAPTPSLVPMMGLSVAEDAEIGTEIGVAVTPMDFPAGSHAWRFGNGTLLAPPFGIDATTGVLSVIGRNGTNGLDFDTQNRYTRTIHYTQGGVSLQVNVSIAVTQAAAPTATLTATEGLSIGEFADIGTEVGVAATAANFPAGTPVWSIVGVTTPEFIAGAFNHFTINSSTGVISVGGELDFETNAVYNLTVRLSQGGTMVDVVVRVLINDEDEFPHLLQTTDFSWPEDTTIGSFVSMYSFFTFRSFQDIPFPDDFWTFSNGTDRLTIGGFVFGMTQFGQLVLQSALDFEVRQSFDIGVYVVRSWNDPEITDDVGQGTLRLTVTDVNEGASGEISDGPRGQAGAGGASSHDGEEVHWLQARMVNPNDGSVIGFQVAWEIAPAEEGSTTLVENPGAFILRPVSPDYQPSPDNPDLVGTGISNAVNWIGAHITVGEVGSDIVDLRVKDIQYGEIGSATLSCTAWQVDEIHEAEDSGEVPEYSPFLGSDIPNDGLGVVHDIPQPIIEVARGDSLATEVLQDGTIDEGVSITFEPQPNIDRYNLVVSIESFPPGDSKQQTLDGDTRTVRFGGCLTGSDYRIRAWHQEKLRGYKSGIVSTTVLCSGNVWNIPQPDTFTITEVAGISTRRYAWEFEREEELPIDGIRIDYRATGLPVQEWQVLEDGILRQSPYETVRPEAAGDYEFRVTPYDRIGNEGLPVIYTATFTRSSTDFDATLDVVFSIRVPPNDGSPADYTGDPRSWPYESAGGFFRANMGVNRVIVATILMNGEVLSAEEHSRYTFRWRRNGADFQPSIPDDPDADPVVPQPTNRRYLLVGPFDVMDDSAEQFSCTVTEITGGD